MMDHLLPDIPRFYTALAEWAACLVFIINMRQRLKGWKLICASAAMLVFQSAFLIMTKNVGYWWWLPCMIAACVFMIVFLRMCMKGTWLDALYCGFQAFVLAEFAASLEWQIYLYFWQDKASFVLEGAVLAMLYGIIFLAAGRIYYNQAEKERALEIQTQEIFTVALIAVSVFAMSNLSFLQISTPFSSRYKDGIVIVRTLVDFAGVAMMYAYHAQRNEIRTRRELDVMQNVLRNQYLQYQQSKESIDLINYKYHDLKHQIHVLRAEQDPKKRTAFLDRMEEEIHLYEVQNKTGHKVVDTILTSKNITCEKYGISLNCVVDGTLLNFMDMMDICSILGNALDNAIECEKKIAEKEKRLIHMAVFAQKNFVILRFENYFDGKLNIKEGVLVTTKKREREYHGYGIKSIQYAVKKYDGAVSFQTKDNWFELKILIPMPM